MKSATRLEDCISQTSSATSVFYFCSVCNTEVNDKAEWNLHVTGKAHIQSRFSAKFDSKEVTDSLTCKTKQLLGQQTKFLTPVDGDVFMFKCVLCDVELRSYVSVTEHTMDPVHETKLKEYNRLKQQKKGPGGSILEENELKCKERNDIGDNSVSKAKSTIDYLSCFFSGELKCNYCEEVITFNFEQISSHIRKKCLTIVKPFNYESVNTPKTTKSTSTEDVKKESKMQHSKVNGKNVDIVEKFRTFVREANVEPLATPLKHPVEGSSVAECFKKFMKETTCVKFFNCLSCRVSGKIENWEEHVTSHHLVSDTAPNDPDRQISCSCSLCETLLFGCSREVISHAHFRENANFFSLAHYPHLSTLLTEENPPRYYKFVSKLVRNVEPDLNLGLYCLVCDLYHFQKVGKHLTNHKHVLKTNITCDVYFCKPCHIVLYGDQELVHDHQLSAEHISMKNRNQRNQFTLPECVMQHQFLLITLKLNIEKNLSEYKFHRNLESISYFCDICIHSCKNKVDWELHLKTDVHNQKVVNVNSHAAEYVCIFCKLSIFGTIFNYISHTTSSEHRSIKETVIEYYNKVNFSEFNKVLEERGRSTVEEPKNVASKVMESKNTIEHQSGNKQIPKFSKPAPKIINELYVKQIDIKNPEEYTDLALKTFLRDAQTEIGLKKSITWRCWYCEFYSSEKKGWYHLQQQTHLDAVAKYYESSKGNKAVALFCCSCKIFTFGPSFMRNSHEQNQQHKAKSQKFLLSYASREEDKESRPIRSEQNEKARQKAENSVEPKPRDVLPDITNVHIGIAETENNGKTTKSYEERAFLRSQSFSSNASSPLCENEEKSEEENDDLYNLLINGESDADRTLSDDELDESVLSKLKDDLQGQQNGLSSGSTMTNAANSDDIEIVKHIIIIKGIPEKVLKNKRFVFGTFNKYGVIKRTYTKKSKPGFLYLLVLTDPEEMFKNLKKNIETLKTKLGTDELVIENDTRNNDDTGMRSSLSADVTLLFSNPNELCSGVKHLINKYEMESRSPDSNLKITILEEAVLRLARSMYGPTVPIRVFVFGSRVTGLASENSDVDIFLQIGTSFTGSIHKDPRFQQQLVLLFTNSMKRYSNEYRNVVSIPFARVPIVKFTHVKSKLNCDLSFKSGLSTMNSILVKTYLELDDRIKFIVCAVKLWMKLNELADRNLFTTYAQIWMVLFFLMQPEIVVVPPVLKLRHMLPPHQQNILIEDWNCAFPNGRNLIWRNNCNLTKEELLLKFFEFYSNDKLNKYVLCTLTGIKTEKKHFLESYDNLPQIFNQYKIKMRSDESLHWKVFDDFEGLCIQDPFDHCHNLTKTINDRKFQRMINLCKQTADILRNNEPFTQ